MRTVLSSDQLACLSSPASNAVFTALRGLQRASAAEVARKVNRTPATVLYHLHRLEECDLAREVEKRPGKRKPEAVFAPSADRYELPRDDDSRELRVRAVQAGLRQAIRGWEKASESQAGPMHIIRAHLRMKPEDYRRFEEMLNEAARFAVEHEDPGGELLHWSSVVYPD